MVSWLTRKMIKRLSSSSHPGDIVTFCLETVMTSLPAWQTLWAWKRAPHSAFVWSHFILTRFRSNRKLFTRSQTNPNSCCQMLCTFKGKFFYFYNANCEAKACLRICLLNCGAFVKDFELYMLGFRLAMVYALHN